MRSTVSKNSYPVCTERVSLGIDCVFIAQFLRITFSIHFQAWLNDLALEMKQTLKQLLKECITAGRSSQGAIDPSLFPSQVRGPCSGYGRHGSAASDNWC